jgi:hypothetical protein
MNISAIYSLLFFSFSALLSKDGDEKFTKAYEYVYAYAQKDTALAKCHPSILKTQKIVVSPQQIPFDINDVMCSYIQKRFQKIGMSCSQINMKEGRLMQLSSDSVYREISKTTPIPFNQSVMYNKAREPEIGYTIMFSDVYKNCVMTELRYFCNNPEDNKWAKKSMVFMFEFDRKGEIKTVYSQEKKYR